MIGGSAFVFNDADPQNSNREIYVNQRAGAVMLNSKGMTRCSQELDNSAPVRDRNHLAKKELFYAPKHLHMDFTSLESTSIMHILIMVTSGIFTCHL